MSAFGLFDLLVFQHHGRGSLDAKLKVYAVQAPSEVCCPDNFVIDIQELPKLIKRPPIQFSSCREEGQTNRNGSAARDF